ncbi:MAG: DUF4097 family beta strand repeat-containing protein [Ilumatobacteraceae bacterium]
MRREERFDVGELARVDVDVPTGSVQARTGTAGVIEVVVDAGSAEQFEIGAVGDTVTVRAPTGWFARGGKANVSLVVPVRTDLAINVATADVNLRGALGTVRARTASSDIAVEQAGRVEAHSASGDVRVRDAGEAHASSASGDIRIGAVAGTLAASSASGDVSAEQVGGRVEISTTSGDIRLRRCDGDDIAVKTVSGDITIGLPSGIRVEPDISTLSGSTILPKGPAPASDVPRRTVRLRARAVSGDVRIERVS